MSTKDLKINGKSIKQLLDKEDERTKSSLYLSSVVYKEFKEKCHPYTVSRVVEALMREFNKTTKKS